MDNTGRAARLITDSVIIAAGTALYAAALTVFLEPGGVSPGGVTGIASIITAFTGLPTGIMTLALNAPLLYWGRRKLGKGFMLRTALTTAVLSAWIDLFSAILPVYSGDRLLAALYGGFLGGIGLAAVFVRGSSTGGTDIAAKIISSKYPRFSIGRMVLILDAVVITASSIAYRSFETALYTTLTIFISTRVIDSAVYGADKGKLAFIITDKPERMTEMLFAATDRGVTVIPALGGYSKTERSVLMCAVRISEAARLHRTVSDCDPSAFLILTDASSIAGEGFISR